MKNFVVTSKNQGKMTREVFYTNWQMTPKQINDAFVVLNKAKNIAKENLNIDFKFWSNQLKRIEIEIDNLIWLKNKT
tara:strand:- start:4812 stop:5042 length:231 start_codon:yes stop_codon:yes gene_type:complete